MSSPATPPPETADESHSDSAASNKSRPSAPKTTNSKAQSPSGQHKSRSSKTRSSGPSAPVETTEFTDLTGPSSQQFQQTTHLNMYQHGHQRLGNSYTEHQTSEFINGVMPLQFMQHPYESALPIIFSTFLATLLGLPHNG
jgi:hypothetical protein